MATKKYEILDHTADAKFKAFGKTLSEAFKNAAIAMFSILLRDLTIKPKTERKIQLESDSKEKLLFDFLDELLFIMDTESLVLSTIKKLDIITPKTNLYKLTAIIFFDNTKNYDIGGNIKAVTYSEISIVETKNNVTLQVVVDI